MSREKGARFERFIADRLRAIDPTAKRGQVFNKQPDIVTELPFLFECKAQETTKIHEWMAQAKEEGKRYGKIPVVVHKRNREEPLITMRFEDFLKLWKGEQ